LPEAVEEREPGHLALTIGHTFDDGGKDGGRARQICIGIPVTRLAEQAVPVRASLVEEGACMISTSCGFLAAYQSQLSAAVHVPVITSSLLQCARFKRPGIVTFDASALGPRILGAAAVPAGTPVEGIAPSTEFYRRILGNETTLDLALAEENVVDAALRLVAAHPDVEDIVLECTNMPPYRAAVGLATGRRVHDLETLLIGAWQGTLTSETRPSAA
jgi:hypothetical protein